MLASNVFPVVQAVQLRESNEKMGVGGRHEIQLFPLKYGVSLGQGREFVVFCEEFIEDRI